MHNSKLKRISVALCVALVPISVFAAGLGKLNVTSGLGEPLKADIELIAVTPEELNSISAAIASEEAYAIQGIEKPASHNTIKVDVAKNAAGAPILKLKSSQPISEPFLDMLIQVDWASGRLLREYTVLLDPPGYTGEVDPNAQTAQPPMVKSFSKNKKDQIADTTMADEGVASAPSSKKPSKRTKKIKPVDDTEAPMETAGANSGNDYTTQRGDTLAKIAQDMKHEGVSLEQMLVGLYQANPEAFQGNMNRLKVGQILRQPSQENLSAVSRQQAASEIKVQTANWNAYRNKLAGIVTDNAPSDTEASTQSAGGKIKSAAEDKSTPAATGPKDVVKLSAGEATNKADSQDIKALQEKITALQEEATAREKSVKEAQDRTSALEKQIADMQKLLALKNNAMADKQNQAAADSSKPAEVPVTPVEAEKPAAPVEPAKPVVAEPTKSAADAAAKPQVAPMPAAEPTEQPGFIASMLDGLNVGLLAPLGGALALLGGGWFYLRKKREKNLSDFEQGIMTSGGLKANTVFGNTASASVDTGDTSFLTDFSQSANGGMIDTNDVDPIAEAEVYMAYGRDAQAEEILKDAISKEPKRHELHLKLLEMYAASKNLSAFETIAGELYTSLGAEDPTWAKVAEIGIKLEPSNPLYQANSAPTGMNDPLDENDFSNTPLAAEKDLDFSFDNDALTQDFAPEPAKAVLAAEDTSFDLPQFDADTTVAAEPQALVVDNDALDFDMGDFGELNTTQTVDDTALASNASDVSFGNTMPAIDMPEFDVPKFMPEAATEVADTMTDAADDAMEFFTDAKDVVADKVDSVSDQVEALSDFGDLNAESFDFLSAETSASDVPEAVLDISGMETELSTTDFTNEFGGDTDFNFDVETITPEAANFEDDGKLELNPFDLTTIDLDLNNNAEIAASVEQDAELNLSGNEPIEVETKLDLVVAYIDMDDKEGAVELLNEVLKEGGANQRKRAEAMLAKLA